MNSIPGSRFYYRLVRAIRYYLFPRAPKQLTILDEKDSLDALHRSGASLARYGDGEFEIMYGRDISFQKYDPVLAQKLRQIIRRNDEKCRIGIPNFDHLLFSTPSKARHWARLRVVADHFLDRRNEYLSMYVSRLDGVAGANARELCLQWYRLWEGRRIFLFSSIPDFEGHPLLKNASDVTFFPLIPKHTFSIYDEIRQRAEDWHQGDGDTVLISGGPTATVLASELADKGIRVLDVGNLFYAFTHYQKNEGFEFP